MLPKPPNLTSCELKSNRKNNKNEKSSDQNQEHQYYQLTACSITKISLKRHNQASPFQSLTSKQNHKCILTAVKNMVKK